HGWGSETFRVSDRLKPWDCSCLFSLGVGPFETAGRAGDMAGGCVCEVCRKYSGAVIHGVFERPVPGLECRFRELTEHGVQFRMVYLQWMMSYITPEECHFPARCIGNGGVVDAVAGGAMID